LQYDSQLQLSPKHCIEKLDDMINFPRILFHRNKPGKHGRYSQTSPGTFHKQSTEILHSLELSSPSTSQMSTSVVDHRKNPPNNCLAKHNWLTRLAQFDLLRVSRIQDSTQSLGTAAE
jgi:hypothetical protein